MGIDIYAKWRGQTKADQQKQYTGFSVVSGNVGYLREAYHGGPYITKYLVSEAFKSKDNEAKIPAKTLRKRLPSAVLMAMYRNKKIYDDQSHDPANKSFGSIVQALKDVFEIEMKDESHKEFVAKLTKHHIEYAEKLIADRALPDYAQSFVDFVELCEVKEKKTGEPVLIHASH